MDDLMTTKELLALIKSTKQKMYGDRPIDYPEVIGVLSAILVTFFLDDPGAAVVWGQRLIEGILDGTPEGRRIRQEIDSISKNRLANQSPYAIP